MLTKSKMVKCLHSYPNGIQSKICSKQNSIQHMCVLPHVGLLFLHKEQMILQFSSLASMVESIEISSFLSCRPTFSKMLQFEIHLHQSDFSQKLVYSYTDNCNIDFENSCFEMGYFVKNPLYRLD